MHIYEVGKPYLNHRSLPEGAYYNYSHGTHELLLAIPRPSEPEVKAVRSAPSAFGLLVEPPIVALVYRFGPKLDGEACYSWHRVRAADPTAATLPPAWEEGSPETRALLQVILADARTGIIRAMKGLTFSPEFTRALHKAIWEQAHAPSDPAGYDRAVADFYRRYPSTAAVERACTVRTKGGA